jgi:hypothetical protein
MLECLQVRGLARSCPRGRRAGSALVVFALVATSLLFGRQAQAQGNDLSTPLGGRSALMGNTGVALARDGAAPFLNPATIVRIRDHSLSFAVNSYAVHATTVAGWHEPGATNASLFGTVTAKGTNVGSAGFRVPPSTLCLFFTLRNPSFAPSKPPPSEGGKREKNDASEKDDGVKDDATKGERTGERDSGGPHRGRQKLAFCFASTEYQDLVLPALAFQDSTSLGSTTQIQSVLRTWQRFSAGPTYGVSLTDELALGISLHGSYTSESYTIDSTSITSTAGGGAVQSSLGAGGLGYSFDVDAVLGALYRLGRVTLGASVQPPALHLFGKYNGTLASEYGQAGTETATLQSGSGTFSAPPPMRFGLGVGSEWSKLAVELDEFVTVPVASIAVHLNGSSTSLSGGSAQSTALSAVYRVPEHPAWNTAVGAEYFVRKSFSILGGASTSLTTLPALNPSTSLGNIVPARTSSATLSAGIGSYGTKSNLLLGTQLGYSWGQTVAVNPFELPNQWAVVGTRSVSVLIVLAGATDLAAIERAAERVERAVTSAPEPPPKPAASPGPSTPPAPAVPSSPGSPASPP